MINKVNHQIAEIPSVIPPHLSKEQYNQKNLYFLHDPMLELRHNLAIPQRNAYLYFPKEEDKIIFDPKKPEKTLRMIFGNEDFNSYEREKIAQLKERVQTLNKKNTKEQIIFPQWWQDTDTLRFLQATSYNLDKSIHYIRNQIEWRRTFFPFTITDKTIQILNTGFMYIHGRDNHYRPIFIVQAKKYFEICNIYSYDELYLAIIYFMEYIINNLLIVGQIENWIIISDISDVSLLFMPKDLKRLIDALSSCYRCRLFRNYIIGMNAGLRFIAKLVMKLLDQATVNKIRFLEPQNMKQELTTFINEENLEKKYGGKAKDLVPGLNHIFPPVMPTNVYEKPGDNLLIKEDQYKEMCILSKPFKPIIMSNDLIQKWEKEKEEIRREQELILKAKTMKLNLVSKFLEDNSDHTDSTDHERSSHFSVNKEFHGKQKYACHKGHTISVSQILNFKGTYFNFLKK